MAACLFERFSSPEFTFLFGSYWALLESVNLSAMRAIIVSSALIPIPMLQWEAQLEAFHEIVYRGRRARLEKRDFSRDSVSL